MADEVYVWCNACVRKPRCDRGCNKCRYLCRGCNKLKPWSNGGTDDERCDECWGIDHPAALGG